jgi:hypothetical protein
LWIRPCIPPSLTVILLSIGMDIVDPPLYSILSHSYFAECWCGYCGSAPCIPSSLTVILLSVGMDIVDPPLYSILSHSF